MVEEFAFELDFSQSRILSRQTFLCNSPNSVQFAFSQKNASFERKGPQMRYALEPLLGDGLFISDGETWVRAGEWSRRHRTVAAGRSSRRPCSETAAEARERWSR